MKAIKTHFPNAKKGREITKAYVGELTETYGFDLSKTLVATSVCSDELNRSATNFRDYVDYPDVFQIGGLAGFPFTGITGLQAFASHIPDSGGAILIYGPHIGIRENGQLGHVRRVGQTNDSTCCGALIGAMNHCQSGAANLPEADLDAQQRHITVRVQEALQSNSDDKETLIHITNMIYSDIHNHMRVLYDRAKPAFAGCKVAFVGGIIINTDAGKPDWFDLRHFNVAE